ncbi:Ancient ubiquitous protein 1 [Datura stramonium]|uniref:Ancient ubiquitous protein 1 n=1 Tax=Datura stramonium TaxID=4076 RepID=A0ABS8VD51_DATST|nr:Ancient ubiquitous protein 1 [Datura stramonium]
MSDQVTDIAPLLPSGHLPHSSDGTIANTRRGRIVILTVDDDGAHQFSPAINWAPIFRRWMITHMRFLERIFITPGSTTVDPFKNNTPRVEGLGEWLKIVVCLPIALASSVNFLNGPEVAPLLCT